MSKITEVLNGRFLQQEEYGGEQKIVNTKTPLVSVSVTAYQHRNFIQACLDNILMQKTNFPIEIVLGEDASTDGSREICIEYAKRRPDLVRLFLRKRNLSQYYDHERRFVTRFNAIWNLMATRGKYIAFCEGDDYWTDPNKLQKQVDFLESHPDFAICFHNMQILYENEFLQDRSLRLDPDDEEWCHLKNRLSNINQKDVSTIEDLALQGNYISTASCLFRNGLFREFPEWFYTLPVGDYPLHLLNAQHGKIKYLDEVMGVYRVHSGGSWEQKILLERWISWVKLLNVLLPHFPPEISRLLGKQQLQWLEKIEYTSRQLHAKNRQLQHSLDFRIGKHLLAPLRMLRRWVT